MAYLPAVKFYRRSVQRVQAERLEDSLQRLELEAMVQAQNFAVEAASIIKDSGTVTSVKAEQERIRQLVQTIRSTPPQGRMVIRLRPPEELRRSEFDLALEDGDRLVIPRRPQEVSVMGAVFNQTAHLHHPEVTVEEYLQKCGGVTGSAEPDLLFVIRADGSADSIQNHPGGIRWDPSRWCFSSSSLLRSTLQPGDAIVVPYDLKPKLSRIGLTSTIAQILFQAAMATGVVFAIL
jgi:hypothetical protein